VASNIYSAFLKNSFVAVIFVILVAILLISSVKIKSSPFSTTNNASFNNRSIISRIKYFKLIYSNILINIVSRTTFNNNGRELFFIINRIFDGDLLKISLISFFKALFYTACTAFLLSSSLNILKLSKSEFGKKYSILFILIVINSVFLTIITFKKS